MHEGSRRASDINPHAIPIEKIPRKIPQTKPTPPDKSHTTGQVFFQIRMNPTPPDHSDRLLPPHNPSVAGSIPPALLALGLSEAPSSMDLVRT